MADYQTNFKRYEKKYLMDQNQYTVLREKLAGRIQADQYGLHTICNIYYDTEHYDLIRTSLSKPPYKEKLRLRSYGVPAEHDTVFLEIKKKFNGIVYKRRISMDLAGAEAYLTHHNKPEEDGQILYEIDWFLRLYHPEPKVFIAYDRIACYDRFDPSLRITFDQNIRFRDHELSLSAGDWGDPVSKAGQVLMEIKLQGSMPLWLCHILNELEIFPVSFSKYGTCYTRFLMYEEVLDGSVPDPAQTDYPYTTGGIHFA